MLHFVAHASVRAETQLRILFATLPLLPRPAALASSCRYRASRSERKACTDGRLEYLRVVNAFWLTRLPGDRYLVRNQVDS